MGAMPLKYICLICHQMNWSVLAVAMYKCTFSSISVVVGKRKLLVEIAISNEMKENILLENEYQY